MPKFYKHLMRLFYPICGVRFSRCIQEARIVANLEFCWSSTAKGNYLKSFKFELIYDSIVVTALKRAVVYFSSCSSPSNLPHVQFCWYKTIPNFRSSKKIGCNFPITTKKKWESLYDNLNICRKRGVGNCACVVVKRKITFLKRVKNTAKQSVEREPSECARSGESKRHAVISTLALPRPRAFSWRSLDYPAQRKGLFCGLLHFWQDKRYLYGCKPTSQGTTIN